MIYASYNIPDYMIYMVPSGMHAAEKWLYFNNEPLQVLEINANTLVAKYKYLK